VELVLVLIILGVLGAAILPRFVGRTEQARIARAKADIANIGLALDLYELDVGAYPEGTSLEPLVARDPPSGTDPAQWNGPYLKKGLPKDPWGRDYLYTANSQHSQDYDLSSSGPDGKPGNDDVTNWE